MTTYVPIPNGDTDQDSPITQPLIVALRDNPIAIAEGASGAPKIAQKVSGSGADTITFSGLGDFAGVVIDYWLVGGGGGGGIDISFSDDGTTYYGSATVGTAGSGGSQSFGKIWVDFSSASLKVAGIDSPSGVLAAYSSSTVTGLTIAATRVRLTKTGSGSIAAVSMPNGGIL